MPTLITNCTARKRGVEGALRLSPELIGASLSGTIKNWREAIKTQTSLFPAVDLYTGRSVHEACRAAASTGAPLLFVSAGMGLVTAEGNIPAYDLTPVHAKDGLSAALSKHSASTSDWWTQLSLNGISQLIRDRSNHLFLIALPASYLRMLADDLAECHSEDVKRLRIFTSSAGVEEVPDFLGGAAMPYDERLETVPNFSGTRADFPQRAMRHYVEVLHGHRLALNESRSLVERFISTCERREMPVRRRLNDTEIRSLITTHWDRCRGLSSLLLRALRDEELVACEQGRFSQLWREVRSDLQKKESRKVRK